DEVTAVARIPDEHVAAGAAEHVLPSPPADDGVVAVPTTQAIVAVATGDRVIARPTVDAQFDQGRQTVGAGERVVTTVHVDNQVLGRCDVQKERRGRDAIEAHASAIWHRGEDFVAIAAVDLNRVDAIAAFVEVTAFAGVPDDAVIASFTKRR